MKAAIYVTESPIGSPQTIASQIHQFKKIAAHEGWTIGKIYREQPPAIGNGNGHATALQQMLKDAENRKFDVLLFWSLDRLSRKGALGTLTLLAQLSIWGICYRSHADPFLDTSGRNRRAVDAILTALLKQESVQISYRTRDGLLLQKLNGKRGPNGRLGPGKPPVEFNQARARKLRMLNKSYRQIALACGVSKATIYRFFNPPVQAA